MTDIETVKMLSGNAEISDDFIAFYLESTKQFILSYCNLDSIPEQLKPTMLEIAALRLKANTNGSESALGEGLKSVASVSDGNQSISYASGSASGKQFVSEEDFVAAYGYMLDRWRKMVIGKIPCRPAGSRCIHRHRNDSGW